MATHKITLQPFNTIALTVGDQYNLVTAGSGQCYLNITNVGTGNVAISNASTVATNDPNSCTLPPNLSITPLIYGLNGVWVAAAAGGGAEVSVAVVPR